MYKTRGVKDTPVGFQRSNWKMKLPSADSVG